jgi:hypothetical protein
MKHIESVFAMVLYCCVDLKKRRRVIMLQQLIKSAAAAALLVGTLQAADVKVKVVNLTSGNYFTPLLVAAHPDTTRLFEFGSPASTSLQAMAEGGDISGLSDDLDAVGAYIVANPAGGLLAPGQSTTATLTTDHSNNSLSIAAMILPTNDGFIALNGWTIPKKPGTYHVYLDGNDAGTEANDEIVNGAGAPGAPGIPADPGGHQGTGASGLAVTPEGFVHIHRGILGDQDPTGGVSDLDSSVHRWLNPIAEVIVTVKEDENVMTD